MCIRSSTRYCYNGSGVVSDHQTHMSICVCVLFLVGGKLDFWRTKVKCSKTFWTLGWMLDRRWQWSKLDLTQKCWRWIPGIVWRTARGGLWRFQHQPGTGGIKTKSSKLREDLQHHSYHHAGTAQCLEWLTAALNPFPSFLSRFTHPVFDSFGCMRGFLLGVILCKYVNQAH